MFGLVIRSTLIVLASCFTLMAHAMADAPKPLRIQPGPLVPALESLAKQMKLELIYEPKQLKSFRTAGVSGSYTAQDAIEQLLRGMPLRVELDQSGAMAIVPTGSTRAAGGSERLNGAGGSSTRPSTMQKRGGKEGKTSSSGTFRLAQATALSDEDSSLEHHFAERTTNLQEVVVTAERRTENIQSVPMSMSALTGPQLAARGEYQFQDYVGRVPGLTLIDDGALGSQLVIRGLTSGGTVVNSPVAVYIDETPYTAVGPWAGSYIVAPNLDTFDMDRIEVLRGPQGTLYGAQALGGLLKYVTNPPDPSKFAAAAQVGGDSVYNGTTGFDVHGMLNLPLSPRAAARFVGYDRYYPGYIDDPSRGLTGINGSHFAGGRVSLLYMPTESLSLRLSGLYQRHTWGDNGNEDVYSGSLAPIYGPLVQERIVGQPGYSKNEIYNLTVNYDLGFANLLSSTSDSLFQDNGIVDYSAEFGALISRILGGPYGMVDLYQPHDRAFTQEIRLSSRSNRALEWQLGVFYTDQRGADVENFIPTDLTEKTVLYNYPTNLGSSVIPVRYREYAGYANLDYHFSPTLDLGIGGRYSSNEQTFHESASGIFFGPTDINTSSSGNDVTYSADLRWRPTRKQMWYARVATGYQPGGPNDYLPTSNTASPSYESSTATDYEMGLKATLLDDKLLANLDVFTIEWRRIQIEAVIGGFNTFTNAGEARSSGVEWQFTYSPFDGLTTSLNGAYTHAYLTAPTPVAVNGQVGDRLPGAPLISGSVGAEYQRPLTRRLSAFTGVSWRFTGNHYSDFTAVGNRQQIPSFQILDVRAGVQADRWSATLYVKNLANKIAIDYVRPETRTASGPESAVIYPPRTIGLSLSTTF
jgi:iron complex outermembrane receptor protein